VWLARCMITIRRLYAVRFNFVGATAPVARIVSTTRNVGFCWCEGRATEGGRPYININQRRIFLWAVL
jgi:hypothetical protein